MAELLKNTVVVLIGFAGTGKYTIGRSLAELTGAKLIHSHLINNSLFTAIDADGVKPLPPQIWAKVRRARQLVYETIRELSPPALSFIFTIQLVEDNPEDARAFADLVELASARHSLFMPIRLICELDELCRRIQSPERAPMLKQISAAAARARARAKTLFTPRHPNLLTLDVTRQLASESAGEILTHVISLGQKRNSKGNEGVLPE